MKAKFDHAGNLSVKRDNRWKKQYCPDSPSQKQCSDSCPKLYELSENSSEYHRLIVCGNPFELTQDDRNKTRSF